MRRTLFTGILLITATVATSAQWGPMRVDPETDPNAFKITTQANLDEAMSQAARLKAQLVRSDNADEREFLITSILEICQNQLNEELNRSGVIVIERKPEQSLEPNLPVRWQGAYSALEDEIRALGEEGINLYEDQYGARARLQLETAIQSRDRERMRDINQRFGLTLAGVEAGIVLASMYWEEGELSSGAHMLDRVLGANTQLDNEQRARLSAWQAHCYRELGERARLSELIADTVTIRDTEVDLGGEMAKLGDVLQQRLNETRDGTTDTIDDLGIEWVGGNYANTGLHEAPGDFDETAWARTLPELAAQRHRESFMGYPSPEVPPYLPVFDGTKVYINSGDRLLSYDLIQSSADPAWECKPFPTHDYNWRTREPDPGMILPVSKYRNTVYAAIENPLTEFFHKKSPDTRFRLYSHYPQVRRALCAVDSATGRLLWKVGGQYQGNDLDQTNFLSSVVYQGTLYAIASRVRGQAEVFLYALDPTTGKTHWNLRLCYGQQETTMFGRPAREPHPSLPAIAGGRLYLCTNIGGVVAVDLHSRSLAWISRYDYIPRPRSKYTQTYYRYPTWFNSPTIYTEHNGQAYIVVAPTDDDEMYAMDASDGEVLWDINQDGHPLFAGRALIGVRKGKVYVGSDGGIRGGASSFLHTIDIENGRVTNSTRVTPRNQGNTLMLAGRPCLAADTVLWPGLADGRKPCTLAEVDLDTMRVTDSTSNVPGAYDRWGYSVFAQHGVVFTVAGKDYSEDYNQLAARFNQQALLKTARKDYETNPDDAESAARYGLLTLRVGNDETGKTVLQRAFELAGQAPVNDRVLAQAGGALVSAYLNSADRALRTRKYDEALGEIHTARKYATAPGQLTECFVREERAIVAQGEEAKIEAFYRDAIASAPAYGVGEDPEIPVATYCKIKLAERLTTQVRAEEAVGLWQDLLASPDRYKYNGAGMRSLGIRKLVALIRENGREIYAAQDQAAQELVSTGATEDFKDCLRLYPVSLAADKAALELAFSLLKAGDAEAGAALLNLSLDEYEDRARVDELQALLAVCYSRSGEDLRARLLATRIFRQYPDGELEVGGAIFPFKQQLKPLTKGSAQDDLSDAQPKLPNEVELLWNRPWGISGFTRLPPQPISQTTPRIHISERTRRDTQLVALDARAGDPVWTQNVDVTVTGAYHTPTGTLFRQARGFALYSDTGKEIWSANVSTAPDPVSLHRGMLVYGNRDVDDETRRRIVVVTARDAATGDELWSSSLSASSIRWIKQAPAGILVMTIGDKTELVLLDAESGDKLARTTLSIQGRGMVEPIATNESVLVADRTGTIYEYAISDLSAKGSHNTRVDFPTMLELHGDSFIVVGLTSATRYDPGAKESVWRLGFRTVTAQVKHDDLLILGTRSPDGASSVAGYDIETGKPKFEHDIKRQNEPDRVEIQNTASFDGGVVMALTDSHIVNGRMSLWGFRLLVLNKDGTVRFSWEHEASHGMLFMQLAVIDDYVALTCDSTTWCFGRRE